MSNAIKNIENQDKTSNYPRRGQVVLFIDGIHEIPSDYLDNCHLLNCII